MAQHFLLSPKAKTLSLMAVMSLTDEEAVATFRALRWHETNGEPVCPRCGGVEPYAIKSRGTWKCRACGHHFSVTSGTIFADRKLSHRHYLAAIAMFVNGVNGHSALRLSRDLGVDYKTAFVLAHKLREVLGEGFEGRRLGGEVEVDGAYVGGVVRQENRKADRKDRRLPANQNGKRQVVVIMRERNGRSIPIVVKSEGQAVPEIVGRVEPSATVYADEGRGWDTLTYYFDTRRINHSVSFAEGKVSTNWAESYFARLRRAEFGIHQHLSGKYLGAYANEIAWREDNRRVSNGDQFEMVGRGALGHPVSREWKGYWQRRAT